MTEASCSNGDQKGATAPFVFRPGHADETAEIRLAGTRDGRCVARPIVISTDRPKCSCTLEQREMVMRSGDDMLRQIVEKSALDEAFRQALLADPKATISQELGITIPESMTIKVHESDMQTVHLALPPDPNITEEQLEAISAGLCCCW